MNWFTYFIRSIFEAKSPDFIGETGEWKLERYLSELPASCHVIRDVYLPTRDGATTQVDAVVVSRHGIFVIEAKNYEGWIFGNKESRQWTTCLKGKNRKFSFQNPLRQNFKHLAVLSELTGIPRDCFHNVVVFVGWAEFKTEMPDGVVYGTKLASYIQRFQRQLIKDKQIGEVASAISQWASSVTDEMRRSHVLNLKMTHESAAAGSTSACPRCGATMILRHRKKDHGAFYGCSQYPSCRGIRPA